MVFPVIGGDGKPTGYEIDNSLRFNEADDSKLVFDPDGAENTKTMTLSFWMKVSVSDFGGDHDNIFSVRPGGGSYTMLVLRTTGRLMFEDSSHSGNLLRTNRLFRDPSAWYHIVLAIDSTDGTASNRVKLYVNGVEETSFETDNRSNLTQNGDLYWGGGQPHQIGGDPTGNYHYGGHLAEMHFVPGSQLTPSSFGETNDNGVWIPKKYTGSHGDGTGGFYLEFKETGTSANASGIGADTSGGTNHFTPTNLAATDITTDTPTNNFATLNSLNNFEGATLSEGNTKAVTPAGSQNGLVPATMGVQNGKWYWEVKVSTTQYVAVGIIADDKLHKAYLTDSNSSTRIVKGDDGTKHSSNSAGGNYMAAYEGSILQVALNLDDGEITFGAGGSWANGSGSTNQTFANSTAAYTDLNSSSDFTNKFILPVVSDENQGTSDTFEMNFGNPPFAISSGNADANGYGNFEYAVPSGYYSLCTKNLAEYG
jgi:hypothetical protein